MAASPERYIVVDPSKLVDRLGTRFPVPVEVIPEAVRLVRMPWRRGGIATWCSATARGRTARSSPSTATTSSTLS